MLETDIAFVTGSDVLGRVQLIPIDCQVQMSPSTVVLLDHTPATPGTSGVHSCKTVAPGVWSNLGYTPVSMEWGTP